MNGCSLSPLTCCWNFNQSFIEVNSSIFRFKRACKQNGLYRRLFTMGAHHYHWKDNAIIHYCKGSYKDDNKIHFKIISIISYFYHSRLNIHKTTGRNWVKGEGMAIAGKHVETYHITLRDLREHIILSNCWVYCHALHPKQILFNS